jgi:predicted TIM-barrel fold metal-dependent hydrolase
MTIIDHFKRHINLNKKIYNISTNALRIVFNDGISDTNLKAYRLVALLILVKNRKHFKAVQELCSLGYGEEAAIIIRSMANALIDLAYISNNNKQLLAERFILYSWVIKKKKVSGLEIINAARPHFSQSQEELKKWENRVNEITCEVDKFYKKFSKTHKSDWSGFPIRIKAEKAGKNIELLYHTVYSYNSDIEHGNAEALDRYMKMHVPNKINILCEPNDRYVQEGLRESFNIFSNIVKIFCKAYKLNCMDKKIEKELMDEFILLHKSEIGRGSLEGATLQNDF